MQRDVLATVGSTVGSKSVRRSELEVQLTRAAANVRGRWIWVHHAPPAGSKVCWTGRKSAGDEFLLAWIKRLRPDIVLSGHIHNSPFHPLNFLISSFVSAGNFSRLPTGGISRSST